MLELTEGNSFSVIVFVEAALLAAGLYRRALEIFEAALDPTHPKVVVCRENYELLLREMS